MKITMNEEEILALLRKRFSDQLIPTGYKLTKVESSGYPIREFHFTLGKEEGVGEV